MRAAALLLPLLLAGCARQGGSFVVGSKNFTESVILGELIAQQLERVGIPVQRKLDLGGTFVCHEAMLAGDLDAYPEYSGTAYSAVLKLPPPTDRAGVEAIVDSAYRARWQLAWMRPFGFDNTFAMLVRKADAKRLGITTLSQAARFTPQWRAGFGYEFMERADGYPGLAARYGLRFRAPPSVMDLGLTYRALAEGKVDLIAGNSTDGQIAALDLVQLDDDLGYFLPYQAAAVVRQAALTRFPRARQALDALGGAISAEAMRQMNYQVDVQHRRARDVAAEFLRGQPVPAKAP